MRATGLFIIVCGPPRSGKTTFCTRFIRFLESRNVFSIEYIEYDDKIKNFPISTEKLYHHLRSSLLDEIYTKYSENSNINSPNGHGYCLSSLPYLIIFDDTMHLTSMRYEVYKLSKKLKFPLVTLVVKTSPDIITKRHQVNPNNVSFASLSKIVNDFEAPCHSIGWEKNSYVISGNESFGPELENVLNYITNIYKSYDFNAKLNDDEQENFLAVEKKNKEREATRLNVIHQVDLIVRKIINSKIQAFGAQKEGLKEYSYFLNSAKNGFMNCLKKGEFDWVDSISSFLEKDYENRFNSSSDIYQLIFKYFNIFTSLT